MPTRSAAAGTN